MFDAFARDYVAFKKQVRKQEKATEIYYAFREHFPNLLEEAAGNLDTVLADILRYARHYAAFALGRDVSVHAPIWGTRPELMELFDLARSGAIRAVVERFSLDEGPSAYERLHERTLRGRAVLVP